MRDLIRDRSRAAHTRPELRRVELAVSGGANLIENLGFSLREVLGEPIRKQCFDLMRQSESDVSGKLGSCIGGRFDQGGDLMVGESRNDGCDQCAYGNSLPGQALDGLEAGGRR